MPRLADIYKSILDVDFYLRISKGEINGFRILRIAGINNSVPAAGLVDISQIPSTNIILNPNNIQLRVVSSTANDTAGGTGIRTLEIVYLDNNFNLQEETIIMAGVTPVNTVAVNINRIWWMHALTVGSNAVADGNISLTNLAGTVTYEYIIAGENQSLSARFCIPNNKIGYILNWSSSAYAQSERIRLRATVDRLDRTLIPGVFTFQDVMALSNNALFSNFKSPLRCPSQSEIKVSSSASVAAGTVGCSFEVLLIDN